MIIPDVNLLLYAHVDGFREHDVARSWWEGLLSGREQTGLAPVVVLGFVRLATSPRVLREPMTVDLAIDCVHEWMARPNVSVLTVDSLHVRATLELLAEVGSAGNLTTDAQIAAHARRHRAVVATNDADFRRFPGVRAVNPLLR